MKYLAHANARIDRTIAAKRRLIALLEEHRGVTVAALVAAAGGERLRLKNIASIQMGLTLGKDYHGQELIERPYLRVANVQMGHVDTADVATILVPPAEASRCTLRVGDVLMTEGGDIDKLGRGTVWDARIDPCLHQNHIFAVRCRDSLVPEYLALWLQSPAVRDYFYLTAKKTTNLASTNSTTLGELPVALPPLGVQRSLVRQVGDACYPISDAIYKATREIALLQEFRTRLIADVVTGQVDVRGVAASLPDIDVTTAWGASDDLESDPGSDDLDDSPDAPDE